ncbi:nucleoside recognition domain-containing protein [Lachnospiraceae bacterium 54-53]
MLNYLWAFMMLAGVIWGAFHGNLNAVTEGAITSAKEAVMLCITMLGIMSFWTGIMEIGQKSGLIERLSQKMNPILRFLFPRIPKDHPALEFISTNIIANVLGLGWAATPAGLKAMEAMKDLEEKRRKGEVSGKYLARPMPEGTASNEMCTFLIINISSLQLIPVNMIAYRSQYGSLNPTAVVGPALAATLISTIVGIAVCKLLDR